MRIGPLRHLVQIQSRQTIRDGYGGESVSWIDAGPKVWASVEPLRGEERFSAQQLNAATSTRIRMRYRALDQAQRITHKGTTYDIQSIIDPEERHEMLEIMCQDGLTEG